MSIVDALPLAWEDFAARARAAHAEGYTAFVYLDATDDIDRSDAVILTLRVRRGPGDDRVLAAPAPREPEALAAAVCSLGLPESWRAAAWAQDQLLASFAGVRAGTALPAPVDLRKDVVLERRVETPWPGAAEESGRARRRQTPPGVPDPAAETPQQIVASAYGGRRR